MLSETERAIKRVRNQIEHGLSPSDLPVGVLLAEHDRLKAELNGCPSLAKIIRNLKRHAAQNEADSKAPGGFDSRDCAQASSVAGEQRRMIRILEEVSE